jgi:hypothetical protein
LERNGTDVVLGKQEGVIMNQGSKTWVPAAILLGLACAGSVTEAARPPGLIDRPDWSHGISPTTVCHYTLTARVRPLLFWISRQGVGGARIEWTEDADGPRGIELLIGSDPVRAPMHVNRWGYIAERLTASSAEILGVMTASDEESMEQAQASITQSGGTHRFKAIRGRVAGGQAECTVIHLRLVNDFTFRDLDVLLRQLPPTGSATRQTRVSAGIEPGFLFALKGMLRDSVEGYRRSGNPGSSQRARKLFVYNATLYELTRQSSRLRPEIGVNGHTYREAIEGEFETRNLRTGAKSSFNITFGTQAPLAETPIRIIYRPRWWFEAELLLERSTGAVEVAARNSTWAPGMR